MRLWSLARDRSDDETLGKALVEFNCGSHKVRIIAGVNYFMVDYAVSGTRQRRAISPDAFDIANAPWEAIIPDTPNEALYKIACEDKW